MQKILINSDKYDGQYVAIKSIDDNTVVGSGPTPIDALNKTKSCHPGRSRGLVDKNAIPLDESRDHAGMTGVTGFTEKV